MQIPADIRFDSARSTSNRELLKASAKFDACVERGTAPNPLLLRKFDDLSAARATLETSASVSQQSRFHERAVASCASWHSDFIRMRDVYLLLRLEALHPGCTGAAITPALRRSIAEFFTGPDDQSGGLSLPALRSHPDLLGAEVQKVRASLWSGLPDSRFKVFQEAFSEPRNFVVPLEQAEKDKLNRCHLSACMVSIDLIPNKLLADLGIVRWPDPRVSRVEALGLKSSLSVINQLKALWESTSRLEPSNPHILVVGQHIPASRRRYGDIPHVDSAVEGSLIYTREKISGSSKAARVAASKGLFEPRAVTVSVFASPYNLYRKAVEEDVGYNTEAAQLDSMLTRWSVLNKEFNEDWTKSTPRDDREALKDRLVSLMEESRSILDGSTNVQKAKVLDLLDLIQQRIDEEPSRPEIVIRNTTAILTRMVKAVGLLKSRVSEIPRKSSWNEQDRRILVSCITRSNTILSDVQPLLFKADDVMRMYARLFDDSTLSSNVRATMADSFLSRTGLKLSGFTDIQVRPFKAFADKMLALRGALREALVGGDRQAAQDAIVKAVVVLKLYRINHALETLRMNSYPGSPIPVVKLVEAADQLDRLLRDRGVLSGHEVPAYSAVYEPIESWARGLFADLRRFADPRAPLAAHEQLQDSIRAYLKERNIEGTVRGLPV